MRYSLPLIALAICNLCLAANSAPQASVHLDNALPTTYSTMTATVQATDADGDAILFTYVWKVNGAVKKTISTTAHTDSLNLGTTGVTDKTQEIIVEVTPNDGTVDGQTVATSVTATRFQRNPEGDVYFAEVPVGNAFSYDLIADGGLSDTPPPTAQISEAVLPDGVTMADVGISFSGTTFSSPELLKAGMLTVNVEVTTETGVRTINFVLSITHSETNVNMPQIISQAVATPNPAHVGESISFTVLATDADADILSYFWDFGDGTNDSANNRKRNSAHTYAAAGSYQVTVSLSDGKRVAFQKIEMVVTGGEANVAVSAFKLALNFPVPDKSSMTVSGVVPLPPGGIQPGTIFNVTLHGSLYTQNFTTNAKGVAGDTNSRLTLKAAQDGRSAKYSLKIQGGSLTEKLSPLGFSNGVTPRKGNAIQFPLSFGISNSEYAGVGIVNTTYKTSVNKFGKATLVR